MTRESNFNQATDHALICPKCGAMNLPRSLAAKPTLELEQDGTHTCTTCGTNFPSTSWFYQHSMETLANDKKEKPE